MTCYSPWPRRTPASVRKVFEAAIPISILAVGLSQLFKRRNTILENVIIRASAGRPA